MKLDNKELVLKTLRQAGKQVAETLQTQATNMTSTELYAEADFIPAFQAAAAKKNMLERPVGFVCRSTAGRVVRLLQSYDSSIYQQEPEDLPAQWGFVWSQNPKDALPFIALATSPYSKGDCCIDNGTVYRSLMDNNVHAPSAYPAGWEAVTE